MLATRVIPTLLVKGEALVKTVRFSNPGYIGDPINTCRIFNELEVDELCFLDIEASKHNLEPKYDLLAEIANECFMPLSYGGGIKSVAQAEKIFRIGFEKVVLNSHALRDSGLITAISREFGSQSVIVAIDCKKKLFRGTVVCSMSGSKTHSHSPVQWAQIVQDRGAGEILLTSIDREGTWTGLDIEMIRSVSEAVSIPVIAHGGAGNVDHIVEAVKSGKASAVALGSMVVYQSKGMGVLVNFPDIARLRERLK